MKYKITKLELTCGACPSQWEGRTNDDRPVYIRYRWGRFQAYVGTPGEDGMAVFDHKPIIVEQLTEEPDGVMGFEEVKKLTTGIFEFSLKGDKYLNDYAGEKPFSERLKSAFTTKWLNIIKKQFKGGNK